MSDDFLRDLPELGPLAHVKPTNAVDVLGPFFDEPAVAFGRLNEPVGGFDEFVVFKNGEAECTGAQGAVVGRFKINGDDFHKRSRIKADGSVRSGGGRFIGEDFS